MAAAETSGDADGIDERDLRAATERLFVHDEGIPGMWSVYSTAGRQHVVDARSGSCTCEDFQYRESYCKHQRRVDMERGKRDVPPVTNVDPLLRERLREAE